MSRRISAQSGYFTIQDDPLKPLEEYPKQDYKRKDFDIFHIRKWKVPKENKEDILDSLNDVGIDLFTLFPDLDGLGAGLREVEKRRSDISQKE